MVCLTSDSVVVCLTIQLGRLALNGLLGFGLALSGLHLGGVGSLTGEYLGGVGSQVGENLGGDERSGLARGGLFLIVSLGGVATWNGLIRMTSRGGLSIRRRGCVLTGVSSVQYWLVSMSRSLDW